MLAEPIAFQRLKTIARRDAQIVQYARLIQQAQFAQSHGLNIRGQPAAATTDQIDSVSESAKLLIIKIYNA